MRPAKMHLAKTATTILSRADFIIYPVCVALPNASAASRRHLIKRSHTLVGFLTIGFEGILNHSMPTSMVAVTALL